MVDSESLTPSALLADYVRHYVLLRGWTPNGRFVRPIIARTDVVLAFNLASRHEAFEYGTGAPRLLPAVVIVGPQTARRADLWLENRWASFSVHFQPAAFQRLFHLPIQPFLDRAVDACDVLGREVAVLQDRMREATSAPAMVRLADAFLMRRLAGGAPMPPAAAAAYAILNSAGRLSVRDATAMTGLSQRHFERRFAESMGIPPKLYARITRLNYVLRLKMRRPELTWAAISHDAGYFDQTHLVKDFKAMAGEPPGSYLRRAVPADGGFLLSSPRPRA